MKLHSIELTNACNLKCGYCPNKEDVKYPKGFLKLSHYLKALDTLEIDSVGHCIGLSVCGEPLLHPEVCEYVKIARKYGNRAELHTNATLLTEGLFKGLVNSGLNKIEISIHTKDGYENFKKAYDVNELLGKPIEVLGQVLSCNEEKVMDWASKNSKHYPVLCHPTHNWTSDEPHKANSCRFITGDLCCMKWDGSVVACCFDFQGDAVIGHIDNFAEIKHEPEYALCTTCSPSWATYQNDAWWWR